MLAREFVTYYNSKDMIKGKARPQIENLEYQEAERQAKQKEMFNMEKTERKDLYASISKNLATTSFVTGISCLRRIEIRYLPLDPRLVKEIFMSL